jgi:hypothetical protein
VNNDLEGRILRLSLSRRNSLYPLFEAVSNSIHAIAACTPKRTGAIQIRLVRDAIQQNLSPLTENIEPINQIQIIDDGCGFTADNMAAFDELDTRYKLNLGGKGVGRLTWLKVFQKITVDSTYQTGAGYHHRTFDFTLPNGVENQRDETLVSDGAVLTPQTSIVLANPVDQYRDTLRYRAVTVAAALTRHFLSYLLAENRPTIEVIDNAGVFPVVADVLDRTTDHFILKNETFTIDHLKIRSPEKREHLVYFCADYRAVKEERLKYLPPSRLRDADEEFFYHAYVSSPYLDANVNEQRTAFMLVDEADAFGVSFSELLSEVKSSTDKYLEQPLTILAQARDEKVQRIIQQKVPELAYLSEHNRSDISTEIPYGATDAEVESALGNIHLRNQRNARELMKGLVGELQQCVTFDLRKFETVLAERIAQIALPSQANLAAYVLYRHSIIELYREVLTKSADRFQREAAVHKLIFPMGVSLDTTKSSLDHNLWLLDERLTFANYIASDRPLREHDNLFEVDSGAEPDIVCYFNLGFTEDDPALGEITTAVIVELKRPGPLDSRKENAWQQVMRYIRAMREGVYNEMGQKIKASERTRFYCYIVCDLDSDKAKALADEYTFTPIFDGVDGYFLYNSNLKAYVELVPFEKVLRDAERKHRALFNRLGLLK